MSDLHQPELDAVAFVTGLMGRRQRRRFEHHLLECEACWEEVRLDRLGRGLAEAGRTVAPSDLRETIRAAISSAASVDRDAAIKSTPPGWRSADRRPAIAAMLAAIVLVFSAVVLRPGPEPAPIHAALLAYELSSVKGVHASMPVPDLSAIGLHPMGAEQMSLAYMPVEAFAYRSDAGSRLTLFMGHAPFPRAAEAGSGATATWRANSEGMAMLSDSSPTAYLAVTSDHALIDRLAGALASGQIVLS